MSDDGGRARRREIILSAAADLFSEHGYTGTGIDEIGEAAGVTGPAVYRHFDNKGHVLSELVERAIQRLVEGVAEIVSEADTPREVLEGLVRNLIDSVLRDRAQYTVLARERRHLEPASSRRFNRLHRLHIDEWVRALVEVRPELSEAEARVVVHAVFGLAGSLTGRQDSGIDDVTLATILYDMSMDVLLHAPPVSAAS